MKRLILAGALALALPSCATLPRVATPTPAQIAEADARLTEVEQRYLAAKAFAEPWLVMMPDAWRAGRRGAGGGGAGARHRAPGGDARRPPHSH